MQILHGRFSLQVGRVSSAGSETRSTIDVVKNETILCSAVSRENLDKKNSPICRVVIVIIIIIVINSTTVPSSD